MSKFINVEDKYIPISKIESFYIENEPSYCTCKIESFVVKIETIDQDYELATFKNKEEAENWLETYMSIQNLI